MSYAKIVAAMTSAAALAVAAQAGAHEAQTLPLDRPTRVNNIGLDCTGVGALNRSRSQANGYSVRLETVGGYGQYLANDELALRDRRGKPLLDVRCDAPWLMIKLDPGRYGASVKVPGIAPKEIWFNASNHGVHNVYVRFAGKTAGREDHTMGSSDKGKANESRKQS